MDYKGITWAGNVYQKFEAMCLEVEEVMYEDTVKYLENQVQKVGVSVKKFYSEMMQDLIPASGVDPVKVGAGDLSLNPYVHTDITKTKPIMSFSLEELKKKEIPDRNISYLADDGSSLKAYNDLKCKRSRAYKRPIGIKRISQDNHKVCHDVVSLSGKKDCFLVCNTSVTSSEPLVRLHPADAVNVDAPTSGGTVYSLASDKVDLAEPVMEKKQDSTYTPCASPKILATESVRQKKDGSRCTSTSNSIDKSRKDDSFSHINSNVSSSTCGEESEAEKFIYCYEENFGMEIIDNKEAFEPLEDSKLHETCVLVEGDGHNFVSQEMQKQASYKKQIRKALSSKFGSNRKQMDTSGKNNATVVIPALAKESDEGKFSVHYDSVESDWEFL